MIEIRRDAEIHDERGGWFRARWHFSFDHYRDPNNDGFGAMRVFNDDGLISRAYGRFILTGMFSHDLEVARATSDERATAIALLELGQTLWYLRDHDLA